MLRFVFCFQCDTTNTPAPASSHTANPTHTTQPLEVNQFVQEEMIPTARALAYWALAPATAMPSLRWTSCLHAGSTFRTTSPRA